MGRQTYNLAQEFPELIVAEGYSDSTEIRNDMRCDLDAMRASQAFLTRASQNADAYDAFVRDGLRPWSDQLERVQARLDELLNPIGDAGSP